MQDPFDFRREHIYTLHFATGSSLPPAEDPYAAYRQAYGERLGETAQMLCQEDWYTLTKASEDLQTIISGIKDVALNLKNIDTLQSDNDLIDISGLRRELMSIVACLYRAGERSTEGDFTIRQARFDEFSECYQRLEIAAQLLLR